MKSQGVSHQQPPELPASRPTLNLSNPEELRWAAQQVQLAIASRAYELFETRAREHGHDWEDWFQAESELLRPVLVSTAESESRISVRANVFGFEESEIRVSIEPRLITILGKKEASTAETEGGKVEYIDWYPDRILQFIELESDVVPERSMVDLQSGVLKFELPKAAAHRDEAAGVAA
jgi:HSP20 family molecular chaperone IbpA